MPISTCKKKRISSRTPNSTLQPSTSTNYVSRSLSTNSTRYMTPASTIQSRSFAQSWSGSATNFWEKSIRAKKRSQTLTCSKFGHPRASWSSRDPCRTICSSGICTTTSLCFKRRPMKTTEISFTFCRWVSMRSVFCTTSTLSPRRTRSPSTTKWWKTWPKPYWKILGLIIESKIKFPIRLVSPKVIFWSAETNTFTTSTFKTFFQRISHKEIIWQTTSNFRKTTNWRKSWTLEITRPL